MLQRGVIFYKADLIAVCLFSVFNGGIAVDLNQHGVVGYVGAVKVSLISVDVDFLHAIESATFYTDQLSEACESNRSVGYRRFIIFQIDLVNHNLCALVFAVKVFILLIA